jgi:pumilio family protein 6
LPPASVVACRVALELTQSFTFTPSSDTKLVGKSIIGELNLAELFVSKLGRRVPLYLLVPRTKRHFTPATTNLLAFHDAARAKTSKKETATRQAELRKAVSPGLIEVIVGDSEGELIRDAGACLLMQETLLYAEDGAFEPSDCRAALFPSVDG